VRSRAGIREAARPRLTLAIHLKSPIKSIQQGVHPEIGKLQQMLAGARLNLEIVSQQNLLADDPAFKAAFELVSQSLESSRTLSMELSPPTLYMHGLPEAFKWLARWMGKTHQLQVDIRTDERADPDQEEIKVLLFQSVRELLFNVAKHSGTRAALLEVRRCENNITIRVSDKGSGFDPQHLWDNDRHAGKSYGLFNIRERLLRPGPWIF